jgi:hypothetical protein
MAVENCVWCIAYFIDEDDAGLDLGGKGEDRPGNLLGLAVPLVRQHAHVQVYEPRTRFPANNIWSY